MGRALDALLDGALLLVGEPEKAEALVLTVVSEAARRPEAPEEDDDFRRWICGRLVRQYLTYARDAHGKVEPSVFGGPDRVRPSGEDAPSGMISLVPFDETAMDDLLGRLDALDRGAPDRLGELIRHEMLGLPLATRATLWLVDVLGASWAEAARALEVPLASLRARLYAGRREMQARLAVALRRETGKSAPPRAEHGGGHR